MRMFLLLTGLALGLGALAGCSSSNDQQPLVIKADKERTPPPPDPKAKTQPGR